MNTFEQQTKKIALLILALGFLMLWTVWLMDKLVFSNQSINVTRHHRGSTEQISAEQKQLDLEKPLPHVPQTKRQISQMDVIKDATRQSHIPANRDSDVVDEGSPDQSIKGDFSKKLEKTEEEAFAAQEAYDNVQYDIAVMKLKHHFEIEDIDSAYTDTISNYYKGNLFDSGITKSSLQVACTKLVCRLTLKPDELETANQLAPFKTEHKFKKVVYMQKDREENPQQLQIYLAKKDDLVILLDGRIGGVVPPDEVPPMSYQFNKTPHPVQFR